jgi:hypothetical protein
MQSTFREEDEDDLFGDNSRKRALSESVTGGAAALLKVGLSFSLPLVRPDMVHIQNSHLQVRNSCSSPSMLDP